MREDLEEHLDSLDAAIFSGDYFHQNAKHVERLQFFIDRWNKEIPSIIEHIQENERIRLLEIEVVSNVSDRGWFSFTHKTYKFNFLVENQNVLESECDNNCGEKVDCCVNSFEHDEIISLLREDPNTSLLWSDRDEEIEHRFYLYFLGLELKICSERDELIELTRERDKKWFQVRFCDDYF